MTAAFSAARKNHLDLSVSIALGSAAQIALFVAPVLLYQLFHWFRAAGPDLLARSSGDGATSHDDGGACHYLGPLGLVRWSAGSSSFTSCLPPPSISCRRAGNKMNASTPRPVTNMNQ